MDWRSPFATLHKARFPIVSDLRSASWPNWREAFKEVFVILFFSLMPLWLGLFIVEMLTITDGPSSFIEKFASSSDLGILSASLLILFASTLRNSAETEPARMMSADTQDFVDDLAAAQGEHE
jgi:hypothetical protein